MDKRLLILLIFFSINSLAQKTSDIADKQFYSLVEHNELVNYEDSLGIKLNNLNDCLKASYSLDGKYIEQLKERVKEIASKHYDNGIGLILTRGSNGVKGRDGIWFHTITEKYGFKYLSISSSCIIGNIDKLKDAYNTVAYSYLDKRNNHDWRNKLENEILERRQNFIVDLTFEEIQEVRRLNLRNRGWIEYPKEVNKLIYLEELSIGYNNLSKIDSGICRLKNLSYLDLTKNSFSYFPIELFCLLDLKKLSFRQNNLQKLPKEINQFQKLEFLDLGGNQIKSLPIEICQLKNLKRLYLNDNNIEKIPSCVCEMKNLNLIEVIDGNNISLEQITQLKEALPNTRIK